jgi:hypothetical protein
MVVDYLVDYIEVLADSICQRVPSIPIPIRVFCKAIYD